MSARAIAGIPAMMALRGSRTLFVAAMLAWLAVIGMGALSGWHGAAFHDHDLNETMAFEHVHKAGGGEDGDNAVHLAAHAVGHGVQIPVQDTPPPVVATARRAWPVLAYSAAPGLHPSSLLEPPQA